jgi:hypothetical protein
LNGGQLLESIREQELPHVRKHRLQVRPHLSHARSIRDYRLSAVSMSVYRRHDE